MKNEPWHHAQAGKPSDPLSREELQRLLQTGAVSPDTLVWTPGMDNWMPASAVAVLQPDAPPDAAPPVPSIGSAAVPRPTFVKVFGILNIVFGSLGLLCAPFGLLTYSLPHAMDQYPYWFMAWNMTSLGVGLLFCLLELISGIGLLNWRNWARRLALLQAWFSIVGTLVGVALIAMLLSGPQGGKPVLLMGMLFGLAASAIGLIYPVLTLIFLSRPAARQACAR